ncbi:N-acetylmuramoyl-L-alanine amidase [Paenibacillus arenosi]|uniref:N-acetylmuramoyl-L-alanine amidase n=1 Tax=Paenibacillus arenosi TaxID=2774142 RepID=A0ABR9AS10_9BACL|nr:N-acetylmuramoyl-L-alanine amidase [Paenibacillus arenosi]MBD8496812.1 N-acetylmuramoyl-L-alanine amidase [Paenibacillus arenosi]
MKMVWKGNEYTNSSSRKGQVPSIIVDHISAGTMSSMDSWFTSPNNKVSSAHFGISKRGDIHQYVAIEQAAWAQGIALDKIPNALSPVVRSKPYNPNQYAVSIEHEGMDGDLTEEQFQASVRLHRYIRDYVKREYGHEIRLNRNYVIGHFQVDPVRKANCPGPKFPWTRLYEELAKSDEEEKKMQELRNEVNELKNKLVVAEQRIKQLEQANSLAEIPTWAKSSMDKAVRSGIVRDPEHASLDVYRLIVILDRLNLIK